MSKEKISVSTALLRASIKGDLEAVRLLCQLEGVDIDDESFGKATALHYACYYGHAEVVKILLEHGARIHHRENDDCTPFHQACLDGRVDVVKVLIEYAKKHNDMLIKAETRDKRYTPVHIVCHRGHTKIMEQILELFDYYGSNFGLLDQKDNRGETPIEIARRMNNTEIVALIEKYKEDSFKKWRDDTKLRIEALEGGKKILKQEVQRSEGLLEEAYEKIERLEEENKGLKGRVQDLENRINKLMMS